MAAELYLKPSHTSSTAGKRTPMGPSTSASGTGPRRRSRTAKACDRCRFKKSKCDGHQPCRKCCKDDSPCLYSPRASLGRKDSMLETLSLMSEGLKMMYQALKDGDSFPGHMRPPVQGKSISSHEILEQLGLINPVEENKAWSSTILSNDSSQLFLDELHPSATQNGSQARLPTPPNSSSVDEEWFMSSKKDELFDSEPSFTFPSNGWREQNWDGGMNMPGYLNEQVIPLPSVPFSNQDHDTFHQSQIDFAMPMVS